MSSSSPKSFFSLMAFTLTFVSANRDLGTPLSSLDGFFIELNC